MLAELKAVFDKYAAVIEYMDGAGGLEYEPWSTSYIRVFTVD